MQPSDPRETIHHHHLPWAVAISFGLGFLWGIAFVVVVAAFFLPT